MAFLQISTFSPSLKRNVQFNVLAPDLTPESRQKSARVLILLHGWSGNQFDWILHTEVAAAASRKGLWVVIPSGGNHFYLDDPEMGEFHGRFVGEELPQTVASLFGLSIDRANLIVGGYSMGGFGATVTGLRYCDRFGGIIALSSAYIQKMVATMEPGFENPFASYGYYRRVFGEPKSLLGSDRDPEALVRDLAARHLEIPRIYLACGTEDQLLEGTRSLHQVLDDCRIPHAYGETPGGHDFLYWNQQILEALEWMFPTPPQP